MGDKPSALYQCEEFSGIELLSIGICGNNMAYFLERLFKKDCFLDKKGVIYIQFMVQLD